MTAIDKLNQLREDLRILKPEKPARAYAGEIIAIPGREARAQALEQVPADIRHVVKFYVASHFARRQKKPLPEFKP